MFASGSTVCWRSGSPTRSFETRGERIFTTACRNRTNRPPFDRSCFRDVPTNTGSVVEIRRGDGLEVSVDGSLVERVVADKDFHVDVPPARFRLNGTVYLETFNASPPALEGLREFTESETAPPWDYASELLADGLVEVHFDLTPRGRRALSQG